MNSETQSIIRAILKIGAGYFISKGVMDESTAETAIAAIIALAGIIWGVMHRSKGPEQAPSSRNLGLLPFALALGASAFLSGCGTPQTAAFKAESGAQMAVETAMAGWNVYVGTYHPSTNTELKVKDAFDKYKATELLAIDATQAWVRDINSPTTTASLQAAEEARARALADLLATIKTYSTNK